MIEIGIIGVGNTGNQLAALANNKLRVPSVAINSSEKDLSTISAAIPKYLIKNKSGESKGAGKNRSLAKQYLKDSIMELLTKEELQEFISSLRVLFVASSTGGGTGSGAALMLSAIIMAQYPDLLVIPIGVMPVMSEALSAHVNSLEYLKELYDSMGDITYMLYDNDRYSNRSTITMMEDVNDEIINDLAVLRCTYNVDTPYDSIDEEDMLRLISIPGRLMVARAEDIRDKDADIEKILTRSIKSNAHVEIQRDGLVTATGLITNIDTDLLDNFDTHLSAVRKFIGTPVHDFTHIGVNDGLRLPNNVYLIISGLSMINDRINLANERVMEIKEAQNRRAEESVINRTMIADLEEEIIGKDKKKITDDSAQSLDLKNIFNKFGI